MRLRAQFQCKFVGGKIIIVYRVVIYHNMAWYIDHFRSRETNMVSHCYPISLNHACVFCAEAEFHRWQHVFLASFSPRMASLEMQGNRARPCIRAFDSHFGWAYAKYSSSKDMHEISRSYEGIKNIIIVKGRLVFSVHFDGVLSPLDSDSKLRSLQSRFMHLEAGGPYMHCHQNTNYGLPASQKQLVILIFTEAILDSCAISTHSISSSKLARL